MKILLCQSYLGVRSGEPLVFPLGLSYLALLIGEKHELHCWDSNVSESPIDELPRIVAKIKPDVVGISLRNIDSVYSFNKRSYYPPFVSMIKAIRKNAPSCKLVVGGTGFSIFAEEIMKNNPDINIGIPSEGEYAFAEYLENPHHPERIRGLIIRNEGRLLFTGKRAWSDFSRLPTPSREPFDLSKYLKQAYSVGVQPKRGCVFGCIFCPSRIIWGCALRFRQPAKVVDEVETLANNFGFHTFSFADAAFNFPLPYSRKLCRELARRKLDIKWTAAFNPAFMNQAFMREAVEAGCDLFSFSADGASDNSLRLLGKNFNASSVEKTISYVRKTEGANAGYSFLYDLPSFNGEHVFGLARLVSKTVLTLGQKLRFLSFSKIRIYPHTQIYRIALKQGKITEDTDLLFPKFYESESPFHPAGYLPSILRGALIITGGARKTILGDSPFKLCS